MVRGVKIMEFLLGLSILIILIFMGIYYYRSCKKTGDECVNKYIEENDEMQKKGIFSITRG